MRDLEIEAEQGKVGQRNCDAHRLECHPFAMNFGKMALNKVKLKRIREKKPYEWRHLQVEMSSKQREARNIPDDLDS